LGQFFSQYLEPIKLNDVTVDWKAKDLGYLTEVTFTELRPFFFIPFCMF
jgi:alpha-1,3-mannosyl-glycoprotein beta-1,2-N-acetylglucosaminyltransferase